MNTKEFGQENKKGLWEAAKAASHADGVKLNINQFVIDMQNHDHPSYGRCDNAIKLIPSVMAMGSRECGPVKEYTFRVASQSHTDGTYTVKIIVGVCGERITTCNCQDWLDECDKDMRCKHITAVMWSDKCPRYRIVEVDDLDKMGFMGATSLGYVGEVIYLHTSASPFTFKKVKVVKVGFFPLDSKSMTPAELRKARKEFKALHCCKLINKAWKNMRETVVEAV